MVTSCRHSRCESPEKLKGFSETLFGETKGILRDIVWDSPLPGTKLSMTIRLNFGSGGIFNGSCFLCGLKKSSNHQQYKGLELVLCT